MTLVGPSFFILVLVVASVTANEASTTEGNSTTDLGITMQESNTLTVPDNIMNNKISSTPSTNSTMTTTTLNSTISPSTKAYMSDSGDENKTTTNATPVAVTPKSIAPTSSTSTIKAPMSSTSTIKAPTSSRSTTKGNEKEPEKKPQTSDNTGIVILVVIILVAVGFGVACYVARRRGRRYSIDFASRPDETNIPLSAVEPELPADTVSQNGLQTFADTPTKEPEAPEQKPEAQEEPKAEADKAKTEAGPDAESAAPATSDKPKEDIAEESPPAPVEPNGEEKTDDESVVSNKTSVESLKETNENNSNNVDVSQQTDPLSSKLFWDVPLDSPV